MQTPKRDISAVALPAALIFTTALTCGVLAALALQIYLGQAGLAFVTGGIVAAALSRLPPPWRRHRPLRWTAGALLVLLLAHIGHSAAGPETVGPGATVAVALAALVIAAL